MKNWVDYLTYFVIGIFSLMLGITVMGQFVNGMTALLFGILCAIVMMTKASKWGPIDLLLLRRWVIIVGLVTLLAVYITGLVLTHGLVGVVADVILSAGMRTVPVYVAMCLSAFFTYIWHIWPSLGKLPNYPC